MNTAAAADMTLDSGEVRWLEEFYEPLRLVGVMAQNTHVSSEGDKVWMKYWKV